MTDPRHSPLDLAHRALSAKMVEFGGWDMPLSYTEGTLAEHLACRQGAVAFDVSHLGTVRVTGDDALQRLQAALTNDLGKVGPGRAQYTHLCADDGSVLDDIIVWWIDEGTFDVMPNASNTARVLDAVGGTDVTADRAIVAIQGPLARARLATVAPEAAAVGRFRVTRFHWEGVACVAAGTGYTGEDGVEVAVPVEAALRFWADVMAAGVEPAGLGARDTLRLEAGLPLHGHELGPGITPLQAGLGWVVAWSKPTFRGKAALEAERADRRHPPAARPQHAGTASTARGLPGPGGRQRGRGDDQRQLLAGARARHRAGLPAARDGRGHPRRGRRPRLSPGRRGRADTVRGQGLTARTAAWGPAPQAVT